MSGLAVCTSYICSILLVPNSWDNCFATGSFWIKVIHFQSGHVCGVRVFQQRLLRGQFAGHFCDLELEIRVLGRLAVWRPAGCNVHAAVGVDVGLAAAGNSDGCHLAVLVVNADVDDAEGETEAAD